MNITILCVGKIKEKFYKDALAEYEKRLSKYCKFQIMEVSDEECPESASDAEILNVKRKEGERLLSKISASSYVITLEIKGKKKDSVKFAEDLQNRMVNGVSDFVFVIGGSVGLSEEVSQRANEKLSFSDMTFPHQLMRVILAEQIYRAERIMHKEPYHK
ncbi:MAG: 23S rRNA (pseudouridine(1915)-N(3))-methyltransferase RlmH [Lachnospiraceae bacterium]|nr:23S rRNA (pseudouridine(1915)-N(3))-methyltransferase RlmH [Lachnospiraceae bacterium]